MSSLSAIFLTALRFFLGTVATISYSSPPQKTRSIRSSLLFSANVSMSFSVGILVMTNLFLLNLLMSFRVMDKPSLESMDEVKYFDALNPNSNLGIGRKMHFLHFFTNLEF